MIEKPDVVVFTFERLYLAFDKFVQFGKIARNLGWDRKIHVGAPVVVLGTVLALR